MRGEEWDAQASAWIQTRYMFWGMRLAASYIENGGGSDLRTYGYTGGADSEAFVRVELSTHDGDYELARDFQGTLLALINRGTGAVVERYRYTPWGEVSIEDANGTQQSASHYGNRRFFLGRLWDAEIGIYDVRARWYEPDRGAFAGPDPLGAVDSWNLYQYGFGTPGTWLDPTGLTGQEPGGEMAEALNGLTVEGESAGDLLEELGNVHSNDWRGKGTGIAKHRFIRMKDGTIIDMKHFLSAADCGEDMKEIWTVFFYWFYEVGQQLRGKKSGAPLGGNEDLGSNSSGADFGDDHFDYDGPPLGDQILQYFEEEFGGVHDTSSDLKDLAPDPNPPDPPKPLSPEQRELIDWANEHAPHPSSLIW